MSNISDAKDEATTNAAADEAAIGTDGSTAPGSHTATVETFVSGTARKVSHVDAYLYIAIKTSAALKVEMGPTSSVATQITPSQSSELGVITLFVPGGWYVKLTGTMADLDVTSILV